MYLISYDISSDRLRTKVAKTLEDYGIRVQYSVFECPLDKKQFHLLYQKLMMLTESMEEGSIRIYQLDKKAEESLQVLGAAQTRESIPEDVIFV